MSLAWKSFHLAMYALTSAEPQRERLLRAYRLHLSRLSPRDLPAEVRDDFIALTAKISSGSAARGECNIRKSIESAEDRDVTAMVNSIVKMYDAVTRYQPLLKKAERTERPAAASQQRAKRRA